jgi:predicted ABC-type ATPase
MSLLKKIIHCTFAFLMGFSSSLNAKNLFKEKYSMANPVSFNACDLSLIYNADYSYSLPQPVLEKFLSGKEFDYPNLYTDSESKALQADINDLYQDILLANPVKKELAVITAGAPGSGKTTVLKRHLQIQALLGRNYAYICPDDVCLKSQRRTYVADIAGSNQSMEAKKSAYNKWRPGSNAATHLILAHLIREKFAFYFGSTSSGPATGKAFEFLKKQGYKIKLIHVSAPDDVRWSSIQERDKTFVQTTEKDVKEKGLLLPQRINDTFLKHADEIEFYYRDAANNKAVRAAIWIRNEGGAQLHVIAPEPYAKIKAIHDAAAKSLGRPDLYWESTVEASAKAV